jgi:uncharacterized protein (TIGR00299 family) protein
MPSIAYFDLIGGASGDMLLGALLDAGLPEAALRADLAKLNLPEFELQVRRVAKNGFSALKVDVHVHHDQHARHLPEICELIERSDLPEPLRRQANAIFLRLGEVEAGIHGQPLEQVHLHELGGVDTIVDVVGTLAGLAALGVSQVQASPVPLGRGFVHGAHGQMPLPAPATLALLKNMPVVGRDLDCELVTPTGAVLLTSLAQAFGPIPPMILRSVGYGAGGRDLPLPNLLRLLLGDPAGPAQATAETLVLLSANLDDQNPQVFGYLLERLFAAGALDVTLAPLQMKKNRPAVQLEVLCRPAEADRLAGMVFAETTTLGLRQQFVERRALQRRFETVQTRYGPVNLKIALLPDGSAKAAPEYEDCRRLAEQHGVPLREVHRAAEEALEKRQA